MADQTENKKSIFPAFMNGAAIAILAVLLVVVLLPLFWMVLTAFKQKGTAFQLSFIPQTELVYPAQEEDFIEITRIEPDKWYLHFEEQNPNATTMEVNLYLRDENEPVSFRMRRFEGGLWAGTVGPIDKEPVTYKWVVGGEEETLTPRELDDRLLEPENGVTYVGREEPKFLAYEDSEGNFQFRLHGDEASNYALRFEDGTSIQAAETDRDAEEGEVVYSVDQTSAIADQFKIIRTRSFGAAVAAKYTIEHFEAILTSDDFNFLSYFTNSLIVASGSGFLTVFICTLAAYAFSTKKFHYRDQIFALLLMSMLVPGMIYMVPQFSITVNLGLLDTYTGMIIPHLANVFGLFLLKQYIDQIPRDLFAAASIDGAREDQVFRTVVIPVCLPIMVTLFLLVFVMQWSNFLWQLIVTTGKADVLTLPVGLQQFKGQNANEWEKIMAGACFSILPIAALFLSLQRYFMEGLTAGSVKE